MGEYADMIIAGESCQVCGEHMSGAPGYPRTCRACRRNTKAQVKELAACGVTRCAFESCRDFFLGKDQNQKYCSHRCKRKATKARKKAAEKLTRDKKD